MELDRIEVNESEFLGPGKRLHIWMHGCHRNCPGCIAKEWNSNPIPQYSLSIFFLKNLVLSIPELEGVTISGGEPFEQANQLKELFSFLRERDLGIIVYTGFNIMEIKRDFPTHLSFIDTLIDNPYVSELDDDLPFRGSSNQNIHNLTSRYTDFFSFNPTKKRTANITITDGQAILTGIPSHKMQKKWKQIIEKFSFSLD